MYTKEIRLERWPHLKDIEIPELIEDEVMLLIGLKKRPRLFFPLEIREGKERIERLLKRKDGHFKVAL